jgi:hypothetical protein
LTRWNKSLRFAAAKRRKNAAHGASRGEKWETDKPQRGERRVLTHALCPAKTGQIPVTTQARVTWGISLTGGHFCLGDFTKLVREKAHF